jgi:acetamidase/formamidase
MIALLAEITGWAREDAYMFCSMACDLHVTQMVNGEKGIHAMVDRARLVSVLKGSHPLALALKQAS